MDYFFDCGCGRRTSVRATQADSLLTCACGRENRIPRLSRLKKSSEETSDSTTMVESAVVGSARMLQIFAAISIAVLGLSYAIDAYLIVAGVAVSLPQPSQLMDKETQLFVRMIWGGLTIMVNVIIFFGASGMRRRKNYGYSKAAAILALIPGLSLCCVLGIPFGLTALSALNREGVRETFSN